MAPSATKRNARIKFFYRAIHRLNDLQRQGDQVLLNAEELGFAYVYWDRHGWEAKWFRAVKLSSLKKVGY